MSYPKILSLGTGLPQHCYTQQEIFERFLEPHLGANRRARAIFGRAGIKQRYTAVEGAYHHVLRGTEERNIRYMQDAVPLGAEVICKTLGNVHIAPQAIDLLTVASCTGFDIPGLDLHLAARLGMRQDLSRTYILGMGCYAAFPALRRARDAAIAVPASRSLALCLELCSLHFQPQADTENVIVSALFGDGAAAALVGIDDAGSGPQIVDMLTQCDYTTFEHMAFHVTDHGFQMQLSSYVPALLGASVETFIDTLLERNGLSRGDVRFWGVHPGGLKIMEHIEKQLGLKADDMRFSRSVLRQYGNMSSPTVLFVLDEIQRNGDPQPGDVVVLMAFGPGLTMESALLRF